MLQTFQPYNNGFCNQTSFFFIHKRGHRGGLVPPTWALHSLRISSSTSSLGFRSRFSLFNGHSFSTTPLVTEAISVGADFTCYCRLGPLSSQPVKFSDVGCDIPELKGDNFKMWKEKVLLHLGWMDIDYAIRKDELLAITNTSTEAEIALYEHWERSNRLSVMFIKTKISAGIRGSVDQHTKVRDLLKAIDEQFITLDKALASTLIMKFCSTRLDTMRGVREHIMKMRDTAAQLKKLEVVGTPKEIEVAFYHLKWTSRIFFFE
ncbi:hypothetical protein F0562_013832 [Nyssa sinensis]|uniref:Uncharacterized protein n=1 Tax=Nyssa sinensis TaxID=561372 RepID=A0A5J4ZNX1_9ASTE|nr:hypothetical protein F0562_013832 [Nyssa sinensis]